MKTNYGDLLPAKSSEPDQDLVPSSGAVSPAGNPESPPPADNQAAGTGDERLLVKVLVGDTVQEMPMRDYLFGVVAAEMQASFPIEALKAQAVAARTYTESKMLVTRGPAGPPEVHKGADVCTDYHHCKAYISREEAAARWGGDADKYAAVIESAVRDTDSMVVLYDEEPIVAVFFAISSGQTESAKDVWGAEIPYLQEVDSPGEERAQGFRASVEVSSADFKAKLLQAYPDAKLDGPASAWLGAPTRSDSGGVISMSVGGVDIPGTKLRQLFELRSTNFTVALNGDTFQFQTVGYGHGVGMSQYGANVMALDGKSYVEILEWYYTGGTVAEYHPVFEVEGAAITEN